MTTYPLSLSPFQLLPLGVLTVMLTSSSASAVTLFSQTITDPATSDGAFASDRDALTNGQQLADDVTLTTTGTVRSVTWWGTFGPFNETPVIPVSFDLIFYGDSGGLPDVGNVISSTAVSFTSLTDTGDNFGDEPSGKDIYVFHTNVTPTLLNAGTKVWFSVLADTSNDSDDSFLWRNDDNGNSARRNDLSNPFISSINQVALFELHDTVVPELTTTALLGLGGLALILRRRK